MLVRGAREKPSVVDENGKWSSSLSSVRYGMVFSVSCLVQCDLSCILFSFSSWGTKSRFVGFLHFFFEKERRRIRKVTVFLAYWRQY